MDAYYLNNPRIQEWINQIMEHIFTSCILTGVDSEAEFQKGCELVIKLTSILHEIPTIPSEFLEDGMKQLFEQQLPDARVIDSLPAFQPTMDRMIHEGILKVTATPIKVEVSHLEFVIDSEIPALTTAELQAKADALTLSEALAQADKQAKADALALSEALAQADKQAKADALALSEALSQADKQAKADALALSEALAQVKALTQAEKQAKADAIPLAEALAKAEMKAKSNALALAEILTQVNALTQTEAQAKDDALALSEVLAHADAQAKADAQALADAFAQVDTLTKALTQANSHAQTLTLALAQADAQSKADAQVLAEVLTQAEKRAEADALAQAEKQSKADALVLAEVQAQADAQALDEFLTQTELQGKTRQENLLKSVLSNAFPNSTVQWNKDLMGQTFLAQVADILICLDDPEHPCNLKQYKKDGWKVLVCSSDDLTFPRRLDREIRQLQRSGLR